MQSKILTDEEDPPLMNPEMPAPSSDANSTSSVKYIKNLRTVMFQLRSQDGLTDTVLLCNGNVRVPAHKVLLVATSPILRDKVAKASASPAQSTPLKIALPDLEASTVEVLLEFIYTGRLNVPSRNHHAVGAVLLAAYKLRVDALYRRCSSVLATGLSLTNVMDVWSLADKCEDTHLRQQCIIVLARQLESRHKTSRYLGLPLEQFRLILTAASKFPNYESDRLLHATLGWVNHDRRARSDHLATLLSCFGLEADSSHLDLPTPSPPKTPPIDSKVVGSGGGDDVTQKDGEVESGTDEPSSAGDISRNSSPIRSPAGEFEQVSPSKGSPAKDSSTKGSSTKGSTTKTSSSKGCLTKDSSSDGSCTKGSPTKESSTKGSSTKGSTTKTSSSKGCLTKDSSSDGSCTKGSPTKDSSTKGSSTKGSTTKTSSSKGCLTKDSSSDGSYTKGSPSKESFTRESPTKDSLLTDTLDTETMPNMDFLSNKEGIVSDDEGPTQTPVLVLISMKGSDRVVLEYLELSSDKWAARDVSLNLTINTGAAIAACNDVLYFFGGSNKSGEKVALGTALDVPHLRSYPTAPMRVAKEGAVAAVHGQLIYCVGGESKYGKALSHVERYCPKADAWRILAPLRKARRDVAATSAGKHLLVVGGSDGNMWLPFSEMYDPEANEWTEVGGFSPGPFCRVVATETDGRVYVLRCQKTRGTLQFDTTTNTWSPAPADSGHAPVNVMAAQAYGEQVYAVDDKRRVFVYFVHSGMWEKLEPPKDWTRSNDTDFVHAALLNRLPEALLNRPKSTDTY